MESLTISYPVKNPRTFVVNGILKYLSDNYGYVALEITVSRSTFSYARSLVNKVQKEFDGFPLYLRFHTPVTEDYDPFLNRESIQSLISFISENYNGGYLIVHSKSGPPADEGIELAKELVLSSRTKGVVLCLENLAVGWSSVPELFEKILIKTGLKGVLDVGHLFSSDAFKFKRSKVIDAVENLLPYLSGAHVYEYESGGHHPALDPYLIGNVLTTLKNGGVNWWTIELEDENSFFATLKTIEQLFKLCYGGN